MKFSKFHLMIGRKHVLFVILLTTTHAFSQRKSLRDSVVNTVLIGMHYKASLTAGDMADRWGFNNQIGLDLTNKYKNNMTVGLNAGFIFGNQLRQPEIFAGLLNEFGTITGTAGTPADILFLMRGVVGHVSAGYVWNRFGNNPNSGFWFSGGLGYMMHKIRIESLYDNVPQLQGDYKKGYDKLTMGVSSRQFIGYLYQADARLVKFYAGLEFIQGVTQNVRTYNFDTGGREDELRFDVMYGLKFGLVMPISQRTRGEYYYE
jgi:hypothetical protein